MNLGQIIIYNLDQLLTYKKIPKLGPDNNTTKYLYTFMAIYQFVLFITCRHRGCHGGPHMDSKDSRKQIWKGSITFSHFWGLGVDPKSLWGHNSGLRVCRPACQPIPSFLCLSSRSVTPIHGVHLSVSACLPACLPVCMSVCMSVSVSVSVCLSIWLLSISSAIYTCFVSASCSPFRFLEGHASFWIRHATFADVVCLDLRPAHSV